MKPHYDRFCPVDNQTAGEKVHTIVIKRDGCQVNFDESRIRDAIKRAAKAARVNDDDYCSQVASW